MKRLVFALAFLALPLGAAADVPLSLLGPEIRVNTTTQGAQTTPAVASTPAGTSVVVWLGQDPDGNGNHRLFGQRFDATGNRLGEELRISFGNADRPDVATTPDGGFVASWIAQGVRIRFYGPDGSPKGDEILASLPAQAAADAGVAVNAAGETMVVWTTECSPPSSPSRSSPGVSTLRGRRSRSPS